MQINKIDDNLMFFLPSFVALVKHAFYILELHCVRHSNTSPLKLLQTFNFVIFLVTFYASLIKYRTHALCVHNMFLYVRDRSASIT